MNRLAITELNRHSQTYLSMILLNEKREYLDFQLFEQEENPLMNRICIGRVENISEGIRAAFVRISKTQRCFLPLQEVLDAVFTRKQSQKKPISIGDELLVQVVKDAVKTKEPVVSTRFTLQGKYSVLTTHNLRLGVSKKIENTKREELLTFLKELVEEHADFGIVLRTNAGMVDRQELKTDILQLISFYQEMKKNVVHMEAFTCCYQEPPVYISRLKGMSLELVDRIYTDIPEIVQQITEWVPALREKAQLYQDSAISLNRLYRIEPTLDELLSNRVWLKSGANIIIEQLETLTFIDVNTGKNQAKKNHTVLNVNKEAATEIARQIKLRNISGMIIIDFINMESQAEEQELISHLKRELKKDSCPCHFIDITRLGLVEVTRKKVYRSLKEIVCGFAHGQNRES